MTTQNQKLRTALNNIIWHCNNAGKGNAVVNERIIDRIQETAIEALDGIDQFMEDYKDDTIEALREKAWKYDQLCK